MVAGEVKTQRINTRYDLTGVITITLEINRPDGSQVIIDSGIAVGVVDVVAENGDTFAANEYVTYLNEATDFPAEGDYKLKITADFGATKKLKSFYKSVFVEA